MPQMTRQQMAEFDAAEFRLMQDLSQAEAERDRLVAAAHRQAGDTRSYSGWGRNRVVSWQLTDEEAIAAAGAAELVSNARYRITSFREHISAMEAMYQEGPWARYFPCLNADGHIHASLRGCPTVRFDTSMGWATEYSGLTADQAIHGIPGEFEGLGETLCSVCFPGAPAEWCRTRSEVTRAERELAAAEKKAARDAERAAKNLAKTFTTHDGDRITTVAAAKALVRKPAETQVELEWNRTLEASKRWQDQDSYAAFIARMEHRLEAERKDAGEIGLILAAREAIVPGHGWSREDQDKAFDKTLKRTRKAYFR